jgi:hypothetical protein
MIFVQSFWSKPFLNLDSNDVNYRVSGGFIDKRYFYYCWVLSFMQLKKSGRDVVLFTDDLGKYILIDMLDLDYHDVLLEFNELKDLSSSYWAIPKLVTYGKVCEPFLHVDGDLILFDGFRVGDVQSKELVFEFCNRSFSDDHLKTIIKLNSMVLNSTSDLEAGEYNCGIAGGRDYRFFNTFAEWAVDHFVKNLDKLDADDLRFNKNVINAYFEQHLLFQYVRKEHRNCYCLFDCDPRDIYLQTFFLPEHDRAKKMTHFLLNLKSKMSLEIALSLQLHYPEWYLKINDLIDRSVL